MGRELIGRYSSEISDPGYLAFKALGVEQIAVYLNGQRRDRVLTADTDEGYVARIIERDGKLWVWHEFGKVEIRTLS